MGEKSKKDRAKKQRQKKSALSVQQERKEQQAPAVEPKKA